MKGYTSENIRNIALLGHGGCGKTTFTEAALLATGVISRLGRVEDGNTVSDYDKKKKLFLHYLNEVKLHSQTYC